MHQSRIQQSQHVNFLNVILPNVSTPSFINLTPTPKGISWIIRDRGDLSQMSFSRIKVRIVVIWKINIREIDIVPIESWPIIKNIQYLNQFQSNLSSNYWNLIQLVWMKLIKYRSESAD